MSVCMCVLKRDISFPSDSKLTQPLPRYQFKFRIRTDYFGLVFYVNLSEFLLFRVKLGTSSFPCNLSFNYSEIINFNWEAQCMRLKFIKVQN